MSIDVIGTQIDHTEQAPVVLGSEKIPTGGRGLYHVTVDQVRDYVLTYFGKESIRLGEVDNTSDEDKPLSRATRDALSKKLNKSDPFVRSINGLTGDIDLVPTVLGLGNVDNTSDKNKPLSEASIRALATKLDKVTFKDFKRAFHIFEQQVYDKFTKLDEVDTQLLSRVTQLEKTDVEIKKTLTELTTYLNRELARVSTTLSEEQMELVSNYIETNFDTFLDNSSWLSFRLHKLYQDVLIDINVVKSITDKLSITDDNLKNHLDSLILQLNSRFSTLNESLSNIDSKVASNENVINRQFVEAKEYFEQQINGLLPLIQGAADKYIKDLADFQQTVDDVTRNLQKSVNNVQQQVDDQKELSNSLSWALNSKHDALLDMMASQGKTLEELIDSASETARRDMLDLGYRMQELDLDYDRKYQNVEGIIETQLEFTKNFVKDQVENLTIEVEEAKALSNELSNTAQELADEFSTKLDTIVTQAVDDINNLLSDSLSQEAIDRTAAISEAIAQEAQNRADAILLETSDRIQSILDQSNAITESVNQKLAEINTKFGDELLNQQTAILDEAEARALAIKTESDKLVALLEEEANQRLIDVTNLNKDIIDGLAAQKEATDVELLASYEALNATAASLNNKINEEILLQSKKLLDEAAALNSRITSETNALSTALAQEAEARSNAINKEILDRNTAVIAESTTRSEALKQEALDRNAAILKEAEARQKAILDSSSEVVNQLLLEINQQVDQITDEFLSQTSTLEATSSQLRVDLTALSESVKTSSQEILSLLEAEKSERIAAINTKIEELSLTFNSKLDTATNTLNTTIQNLETGVTTSLTELRTKDSEIISNINAYKLQTNDAIAAVVSDINLVNTEQSSTVSKLDGLSVQVGDLSSDFVSYKEAQVTENTALSTKIDNVTTSIDSLNGEVSSRIGSLEQTVSTLDSATSTKFETVEASLSGTNTLATDAKRIAESAVTVNSAQTTDINSLKSRVMTVEGDLTTKADSDVVDSLTTRVDGIGEDLLVQAQSITSLTSSLNITDEKAGTALSNAATAQNTANTAVTANKATSDRLDTLSTTVSNNDTSVKGLIQDVANTVTTLEESTNTKVSALESAILTTNEEVDKKATSTALNQLDTQVKDIDGKVNTNSTSLTTLSGKVDQATADIATKASSSTVDSLTSRVTTAEGILSSQGSAITLLTGSLETTNNNVNKKADSSALSALEDKVVITDQKVSANSSRVDTLENEMELVQADVATKATASALNSLTTRVTSTEGVNETQGNSITKLQNDLVLTNTEVATKASTTAFNTLDSKVTSVDDRVTANTNSLTSLGSRLSTAEGTLSKKLDATAITDYYTKTETDTKATTIAAGEISKYDASLVIGGINLITNSAFKDGTKAWQGNSQAVLSIVDDTKGFFGKAIKVVTSGNNGLRAVVANRYNQTAGEYYTFSGWVRADVTTTVNVYIGTGVAKQLSVGTTWQYFTYTQKSLGGTSYDPKLFTTVGTLYATNLKAERGTKATDWSISTDDTQNALDANATAIQTTNTEVARVDGAVKVNSSSINSLTSRLSTVEDKAQQGIDAAATAQNTANTAVNNTEANATAISNLDTKFTTNDTDVRSLIISESNSRSTADTALGSRIDTLTTTVTDNNTTISGRITDVENSVTTLEGNTNTKISNLQSSLNNLNTTVGNKADASALTALTTRVANTEGVNTSQATSLTNLNSNLTKLDELTRTMNSGKLVYNDPLFKLGLNNVTVYDNSKSGNVIHTRRERSIDNPTTSTHELSIKVIGLASPSYGGLIQTISARPNAVFLTKYIAKLPVGYYFATASNAIGSGGTDKLYGQSSGTGKFDTFYRVTRCGAEGSFSTSGHLYVAGGPAPSVASPLELTIASIELYDCTDFQEAPTSVLNAIADAQTTANTAVTNSAANANLINTLTTTVNSINTDVNGRIDDISESVTTLEGNTNTKLSNLESSLNTLNGTVGTKADSSALNSTNTEVSRIDGVIVAQSSSISKLQSDLNQVDTKANTAVTNAALAQTTADTAVTNSSANSTQITALDSRLKVTESDIAKKANASVLNQYYTKTEADTAAAGQITAYKASLKIGGANLYPNTSSEWQSRTFAGWQSYFDDIDIGPNALIQAGDVITFSATINPATQEGGLMLHYTTPGVGAGYIQVQSNKVSAGSTGLVFNTSTVPSTATKVKLALRHFSDNIPSNVFKYKEVMLEKGNVVTAWSPSIADINKAIGVVSDANAAAVQATNTEVSRINGVVTSQGTAITNLTNNLATTNSAVSTKANSSAVTTLDNKVTAIDDKVTTNASAITALQGRATTIEGNVAKKAEATSVTSLGNRVTTAEGNITTATNATTRLTSFLSTSTTSLKISGNINATSVVSNIINSPEKLSLVDDASAVTGKVLRVGTNSGSDYVSYLQRDMIAIDPTKTYRVKWRYRRVVGTQSIFLAVCCVNAEQTNGVTASNSLNTLNVISSELYVVAGGKPQLETWTVGEYYIKGKSTGASSGAGTKADPKTFPALAAYIRLGMLLNYNTGAGQQEIDYFLVEEAPDVDLEKNTATALNDITTNISDVSGRVTANANAITGLQTTVDGKANSSVLVNYYTKTEADIATAGHINAYNSSLVIGGTNLFSLTNIKTYAGGNLNPNTYTVTGNQISTTNNGSSSRIGNSIKISNTSLPVIVQFKHVSGTTDNTLWYTCRNSANTVVKSQTTVVGVRNAAGVVTCTIDSAQIPTTTSTISIGIGGPGTTYAITDVMVVNATNITAWQPSSIDTQSSLDANSNSISTTNTEVARVNGIVVSQGTTLNQLTSNLATTDAKAGTALSNAATAQSTANTGVTKADAAANTANTLKTAYEAKVALLDSADAKNAADIVKTNTDLSSIQTALSNADTALGGRIDSLSTTVSNNDTTVKGLIETTNSSITNLQGNVNTLVNELNSDISNINLRGQDLVSNGLGQLQSNKYWSGTTYTALDKPSGVGSFRAEKGVGMVVGNEFIPVDPTRTYRLSFALRQITPDETAHAYGMFVPFDVDKLGIAPQHYMAQSDTLTTLAIPLKKGDTTITLTDASKWYNTNDANTHMRSAIFWNYVDGTGYQWPVNTYSRNSWRNLYDGGSINGNVITLRSPWSYQEIPAGTQVSNGGSGSTYMYIGAVNAKLTENWVTYSGEVSGAHPSGIFSSASNKLPMMTAYVRIGFLINRSLAGANVPNSVTGFGGISLRDWSVAKDPSLASSSALNALDTKVTDIDGRVTTNASSITSLGSRMSNTENTLSTKADSSAVSSLTTRISDIEGVNTTQSNSITSLSASLDKQQTNLRLPTEYDSAQVNKWLLLVLNKASNTDTALPTYDMVNTLPFKSASYVAEGSTMVNANDNVIYAFRSMFYVPTEKILNLGKVSGDDAHVIIVDGKTVYSRTTTGASTTNVTFVVTSGWHVIDVLVNEGTGADGFTFPTTLSSQVTNMFAANMSAISNVKADTTALNATNATVSSIDGRVTTNANNITSLQGSVSTINNALTTKADVSVLNDYYTKVQTEEKATEIAAGAITKFDSSLIIGGTNLVVDSDIFLVGAGGTGLIRTILLNGSLQLTGAGGTWHSWTTNNTRNSPTNLKQGDPYTITLWVKAVDVGNIPTIMPHIYIDSFKKTYMNTFFVIGDLSKGGTVKYVLTSTAFSNTSTVLGNTHMHWYEGSLGGGLILEKWQIELGTKSSDWSPAPKDITNKLDANSTAINTTNTEVSRINGVVSTQASSISKLQSDLVLTDAKAGTALTNAATAQTTANTAVNSNAATASSLNSLSVSFNSTKESGNSLIPDYYMKDPNAWRSHNDYDLSSYFTTVSDGVVGPTVFRKPATIGSCWNYSRTSVPNDRAYKVSMWVRRGLNSSGLIYFTVNTIDIDGIHDAVYSSQSVNVPVNNTWVQVSAIFDLVSSKATSPQLAFGFALNHSAVSDICDMQGFKVEAVLSSSDLDSSVASSAALTSAQSTLADADRALGTRIDTLTTTVTNNNTAATNSMKTVSDSLADFKTATNTQLTTIDSTFKSMPSSGVNLLPMCVSNPIALPSPSFLSGGTYTFEPSTNTPTVRRWKITIPVATDTGNGIYFNEGGGNTVRPVKLSKGSYIFSCYAKTELATSYRIGIQVYPTSVTTYFDLTKTLNRFSFKFNVVAETADVCILLMINPAGLTATGSYYIERMMLERTIVASNASPSDWVTGTSDISTRFVESNASITSLSNTVTTKDTAMGKRVDDLTTTVTNNNTTLTSKIKEVSDSVTTLDTTTNSKITALTSRLDTADNKLATKADAEALSSLDTRVTNTEAVNASQATSLNSLSSTLGEVSKTIPSKTQLLDLSALNADTYYPVTMVVNTTLRNRIIVKSALSSGSKPTWATHTSGFSCQFDWETTGSGWGGATVNRVINTAWYQYSAQPPAIGIGQLTNSSREYIFLRGGAVYNLATSANVYTAVIHTESVTFSSQTIAPRAYDASLIIATIWSEKASTTALNATNTEVSRVNGLVTTQGSSISKLQSDLTALDTETGQAITNAATAQTTANTAVNTSSANASQITSLDSRLGIAEGKIGNKADASALNSYYTKTEADNVLAGQLSNFNASLRIGNENLILKTKWKTPTFSDTYYQNGFTLVKSTSPYTAWAQYGPFSEEEFPLNTPAVFSFKIKALDNTPLTIGGHFLGTAAVTTVAIDGVLQGNTQWSSANITIPNDSKWHIIAVFATRTSINSDFIYIQPNRGTSYSQAVNCSVKDVMLSLGNTYTEWVEPLEVIRDRIAANATAIQSTNTEITRIDGRVTANSNSINSLNSKVATVEGTLVNKADASVLSNYYTKSDADNVIAGKLETFNANLQIGGVNLLSNGDFSQGLTNWEGTTLSVIADSLNIFERIARVVSTSTLQGFKCTNTYATTQLKLVAGKTYTFSGWLRSTSDATLSVALDGSGTGSAQSITVSTTWKYFEVTRTVKDNMIPRIYGVAEFFVAQLQIEEGNKATSWSPNYKDTQGTITANTTAIQTTNTEVSRVNGVVTTQGSLISGLRSDLNTVDTKAGTAINNAATAQTAANTAVNANSVTATSLNTLSSKFDVSAKAGTNLLINSNVEVTYKGDKAYPHAVYKLGEDWEVGSTYTLLWCATHTRVSGDTTSTLAVYAGGGLQNLQSINGQTKKVSKITFVKSSSGVASVLNFFLLSTPAVGVMTTATIHWAVLVKGDVITTDSWIPSSYDYIAANIATNAAITSFNTTLTDADTALANRLDSLTSTVGTNNTTVTGKINDAMSSISTLDGNTTLKFSTLDSNIATINNNLATKLNASAINDYYTKSATDSSIAGKLDTFNANLVIGGVNQLLNSEAERTATPREYMMYEASAYMKAFYEDNLGKDVTISFDLKVPVAGSVQVYNSNGSFHTFSAGVTVATSDVNQWKRYSVTVKPSRHATNTSSSVSGLEFYGTYGTGRFPSVRKVQVEAGSKATSWSPGTRDIQNALDANASAIQTTNANVATIDGKVTVNANAITALNSSLTTTNNKAGTALTNAATAQQTANTAVTKDAATSARVDALTTTVEGNNTLVNGRINDVVNSVSTLEGNVNNKITTLQSNMESTLTFTGMSGASDIGNDLVFTTTVGETSKTTDLTAASGQVLSFGNNSGNDVVWVRAKQVLPIDPSRTYRLRFRYRRVSGSGTIYLGISCLNSTKDKYVTTSNSLTSDLGSSNYLLSATAPALGTWVTAEYFLKGKSTGAAGGSGTLASPRTFANQSCYFSPMIIANYVSSPGIVELDYANVEIADDLEEARATSNALTALTTRVTNAEGVNDTQTTSITNLTNNLSTTNNAVSTKADSSALNTLSSKVTGIDGVVSTHTSAITALEGRATTIEGNVAKKLESSAITNYYTKTEADTATAGHINNYNANLVIGGTNLLKNSDFSSGLTHWEGGSATLTIIDDSLSKFKKVVKVVSTATTGGIKVVNASSIGMMTANETYTISGWIRSASNLTVYISLDGSGNANSDTFSSTTEWKYFTVTKRVTVNLIPSIYGLGEYYVSNLKLEKGVKSTDWSPNSDEIQTSLDANASAISLTNTEVSNVKGTVTSQGTSITNLQNSLSTVNNALSTKADSSALNTLTNRVTDVEGTVTSQGSNIVSLTSSVNTALSAVTVTDTRSTNQPPSWYFSNHPRRIVNEFKTASAIGVTGLGTYVNLETRVYYGDSSGGSILQIAHCATDTTLQMTRYGSTSTWTAWVQPLKVIKDAVSTKADATALSSLDTKVTSVDGRLTSLSARTDTLSTTLDTNTAKITEQSTTVDGIKAVKTITVDNNGVVSGYGLVSELVNGNVTSAFAINADQFYIGAPSSGKKPFTVLTSPGTVNGIPVPAGTYIDTAYIADATITSAKIQELNGAKITAGSIKAEQLSVQSLSALNAKIGTITTTGTQGSMTISDSLIEIRDAAGNIRVRLGIW